MLARGWGTGKLWIKLGLGASSEFLNYITPLSDSNYSCAPAVVPTIPSSNSS